MDEEKYNYLLNFGFSPLDIDDIEIYNNGIYVVEFDEIKKTLDFLLTLDLSKKELIKIINNNYSLITENVTRLLRIKELYSERIGLNNKELGDLLRRNNQAFSITITTFNEIIDYIYSKNVSPEKLKNVISKHPSLVGMTLEEIKKMI